MNNIAGIDVIRTIDELINYCKIASPSVSPLSREKQLHIIKCFIRPYVNNIKVLELMKDAMIFIGEYPVQKDDWIYRATFRKDWQRVDSIIDKLFKVVDVDIQAHSCINTPIIIDDRLYSLHYIAPVCKMPYYTLRKVIISREIDNTDSKMLPFKYRLICNLYEGDKKRRAMSANILKVIFPILRFSADDAKKLNFADSLKYGSNWVITDKYYFDGEFYQTAKSDEATVFDMELIPLGCGNLSPKEIAQHTNSCLSYLYERALIACLWECEYANCRDVVKIKEFIGRVNSVRNSYYVTENMSIDSSGYLHIKVAKKLATD